MSYPDAPAPPDPSRTPPPSGGWPAGPPSEPWPWTPHTPAPEPAPSRTPIYVALLAVAILSGAALFASGYTLGLQQAMSPGTPAEEQARFDPFWEAYQSIRTQYVGEIDPDELVDGAISGMFRALGDPYSSYMSREEYERNLDDISREFEGVGAEMDTLDAVGVPCEVIGPDCRLLVGGVLEASPAEAGGLREGDEVVAVDGVPVSGSTSSDIVDKVRGPKGTQVRLTILRRGMEQELTLTRDVIRSESVESRVLADGTVGYLRVDGFSASTADDLEQRLEEQLAQGISRFVLDLRDDPGGYVDAALGIASEFIASGPIYWEEDADGAQTAANADGGGLATDPSVRVAVLVNAGSASASEILAGAMQDTGRGTLVGETTYGKGTIQQWHELAGEHGGFRLSVAKWLTPDKRWVDGVGLEPDVPVAAGASGDDPQLDAALDLLAQPTGAEATPAASAS